MKNYDSQSLLPKSGIKKMDYFSLKEYVSSIKGKIESRFNKELIKSWDIKTTSVALNLLNDIEPISVMAYTKLFEFYPLLQGFYKECVCSSDNFDVITQKIKSKHDILKMAINSSGLNQFTEEIDLNKPLSMLKGINGNENNLLDRSILFIDSNNNNFTHVLSTIFKSISDNKGVLIVCNNLKHALPLQIILDCADDANLPKSMLQVVFIDVVTDVTHPRSIVMVEETADLFSAAHFINRSLLYFHGKTSLSTKFLFVQENIYEKFKKVYRNILTSVDGNNEIVPPLKTFIEKSSKQGARHIADNAMPYLFDGIELTSSFLMESNFMSLPNCGIVIPFKTPKDFISLANYVSNKIALQTDSFNPLNSTYFLNLFTEDASLTWQMIPKIEKVPIITINGDYKSIISLHNKKVHDISFYPCTLIKSPGSQIDTKLLNELYSALNELKKLSYENRLKLCKVSEIKTASKLDFSLDLQENELLFVKSYIYPKGIIYLDVLEKIDEIETLGTLLKNVVALGNIVIMNCSFNYKDLGIDETLKPYIWIKDLSDIELISNGIQRCGLCNRKNNCGSENLLNLSVSTTEVYWSVGGNLFAN